MKKVSIIIMVLSICSQSITGQLQPNMTIEIFRHGARGPINATYDVDNYWGVNIGELTGVGMRQHFILGNIIKSRYPSLIGNYTPSSIYVRSTEFNRTLMSAYSHLYGIYEGLGPGLGTNYNPAMALPPYNDEPFMNNLLQQLENSYAIPFNYQPVPVHTVQQEFDTLLLAMSQGCPNAEIYANQNIENSTKVWQYLQPIVEKINSEYNLEVSSLQDMNYLGDTCVANYFQNISLPGGIIPFSEIYNASVFAFQYWTVMTGQSQLEQQYLNAFNLFWEIYNLMNSTLNGTSPLPYAIFSAHDSTLAAVLNAMGYISTECLFENYEAQVNNEEIPYPMCIYPAFASNIIFEVYNNEGNSQIKAYYNGNPLPICNNEIECSFTNFETYIQLMTGNNTEVQFNEYCGTSQPPQIVSQSSTLAIVLGILSGVLLVILIYLCMQKPGRAIEEDVEYQFAKQELEVKI